MAYFKPVQTGVDAQEVGDAEFVAEVASVPVYEGLRVRPPLAPAVAAEMEGVEIEPERLVARALELAAGVDELVVEGAGGVLVEMARGYPMAEFARVLAGASMASSSTSGFGVVIATRPDLGTLNHTALSVEALRRRGIEVEGLVISGWPADPTPTHRSNREELARIAPLLGFVRLCAGLDTQTVPGDLAGLGSRPPVAWSAESLEIVRDW